MCCIIHFNSSNSKNRMILTQYSCKGSKKNYDNKHPWNVDLRDTIHKTQSISWMWIHLKIHETEIGNTYTSLASYTSYDLYRQVTIQHRVYGKIIISDLYCAWEIHIWLIYLFEHLRKESSAEILMVWVLTQSICKLVRFSGISALSSLGLIMRVYNKWISATCQWLYILQGLFELKKFIFRKWM